MGMKRLGKLIFLLAAQGLILVPWAKEAAAVPSFARQTGQPCSTCHTMFPELKPFGRAFKLNGYVLNNTGASYPTVPPLAGMAQISFTHTDHSQPPGSLPSDRWSLNALSSGNDVFGTPQAGSVFYAGQIYGKVGAMIQATYSNDDDRLALDQSDIRYANSLPLCGKDLVFGITLNNNPTAEDVWNSTPAFGFPYATSNIAPTPSAATLIDNALLAQVGGAGLYGYWNDTIYAGVTLYRTSLDGITSPFGAGNHPLSFYVDGAIPYWRVALTRQSGPHSFEIGTYGLSADNFVSSSRSGPTDNYRDVAIDAQYQYIQGKQSFSLQTTWIHEDEDRSGSFATQAASNLSDRLNTFRINGNYYRTTSCGIFGGSVSYFSTTGSNDLLLYAGNPNGSPDSAGEILELDYMPPSLKCVSTKLSLQYVIYNQFNGASGNASDNNTLYLLAWLMF